VISSLHATEYNATLQRTEPHFYSDEEEGGGGGGGVAADGPGRPDPPVEMGPVKGRVCRQVVFNSGLCHGLPGAALYAPGIGFRDSETPAWNGESSLPEFSLLLTWSPSTRSLPSGRLLGLREFLVSH
jgi:hypothetical protein